MKYGMNDFKIENDINTNELSVLEQTELKIRYESELKQLEEMDYAIGQYSTAFNNLIDFRNHYSNIKYENEFEAQVINVRMQNDLNSILSLVNATTIRSRFSTCKILKSKTESDFLLKGSNGIKAKLEGITEIFEALFNFVGKIIKGIFDLIGGIIKAIFSIFIGNDTNKGSSGGGGGGSSGGSSKDVDYEKEVDSFVNDRIKDLVEEYNKVKKLINRTIEKLENTDDEEKVATDVRVVAQFDLTYKNVLTRMSSVVERITKFKDGGYFLVAENERSKIIKEFDSVLQVEYLKDEFSRLYSSKGLKHVKRLYDIERRLKDIEEDDLHKIIEKYVKVYKERVANSGKDGSDGYKKAMEKAKEVVDAIEKHDFFFQVYRGIESTYNIHVIPELAESLNKAVERFSEKTIGYEDFSFDAKAMKNLNDYHKTFGIEAGFIAVSMNVFGKKCILPASIDVGDGNKFSRKRKVKLKLALKPEKNYDGDIFVIKETGGDLEVKHGTKLHDVSFAIEEFYERYSDSKKALGDNYIKVVEKYANDFAKIQNKILNRLRENGDKIIKSFYDNGYGNSKWLPEKKENINAVINFIQKEVVSTAKFFSLLNKTNGIMLKQINDAYTVSEITRKKILELSAIAHNENVDVNAILRLDVSEIKKK